MKPFLDVGFKNYVFPENIVILLNPNSQPIIRFVKEKKDNGECFDIRQGKKTRSVLVLDTGEIIVSPVGAKTIQSRYLKYADEVNKNNTARFINPFLEIGFMNYVLPERVSIILNPNSQPTIRLIKDAKNDKRCFDIKQGKKTRSVLVLNTGEIVISAIETKTIQNRYFKYINEINKTV